MTKIKVTIEFDRKTAKEMPLLFKQEWLSGKDDGGDFSLSCGAGLGSPYLELKVDGIYYLADIRDVMQQAITMARLGLDIGTKGKT